MNIRQMLVAAGLAAVVAAPVAADAQYRPGSLRNDRNYPRNDRRGQSDIERLVINAERESNRFRQLVERGWDSRRERDWNRGWDNDWSRGRGYDNNNDRDPRFRPGQGNSRRGSGYGQGYGDPGTYGERYEQDRYGRNDDWGRDSRYGRRYSPKESVQRLDQALERLRHAVTRNRNDSRARDYIAGRDEMREVMRAADNVDFYFGRGRGHNGSLEREWSRVKQDLEPLARFYNARMFGRW